MKSYIEDTAEMAKVVNDEDIKMFIISDKNNPKDSRIRKKSHMQFNRFHHPKQTISDYFKDNKSIDFNSKWIEKFLEQGVLDNVLFNFLFSRGMALKDVLIDVDRAYTMVRKINKNELDFPEKVPDQPLNEDEKLKIV